MSATMNTLLTLMILSDFLLLTAGRLALYVRLSAVQGLVLGLLILARHETWSPATLGFVALTVGMKSVLFPGFLRRILRDAQARREAQPWEGYTGTLLLGAVALLVSLWLSRRFPLPAGAPSLAVPAAFFTLFSGIILICLRHKALTQALGYLVMENGVFVAGITLVPPGSLVVELGILLDLLVAVFLMGILIFHIYREFDHIDADQLTTLRDWGEAPPADEARGAP